VSKQPHKEFNHIFVKIAKEIKRLIYQGLGLYHLPDGEARPELAEAECKHALQPGWQAVHIEVCSSLSSPP